MTAAVLASLAGNCIGKRQPLLLTLAIATAAANANRPNLDLQLKIADSSPVLPGEQKAAAGTASDKSRAVAQHFAATGHGLLREAMPHGHADEGPRTRVRAVAALQVRDKEEPEFVASPFEETKSKLQAIHDSEIQSANTHDKIGTATENQNQGTLLDPTSPSLKEGEKAKTEAVVVQKVKSKENEIEQRYTILGIRYMLEEAEYAVDVFPAWLQGIMFVINMMIGSAVIYFLHTTKYRPEHGCATAFCFFCCWPCGILSLCFPVDEATPDFKPEDREPEMIAGQQQEAEPPTFAQDVPEDPRTSVTHGMPEEPHTSMAHGMPEQPAMAHGMPEAQPAVMPTPEVESNKRESTVNVSLT